MRVRSSFSIRYQLITRNGVNFLTPLKFSCSVYNVMLIMCKREREPNMRIIFQYNASVNGRVVYKNANCRSGFKVYM